MQELFLPSARLVLWYMEIHLLSNPDKWTLVSFWWCLHSHLPTNEVIRCVSKAPIWWASHFGFGSREWELTGADGANVCHCQPGVWCFRDQSITESSKHLERDGCAPEPPHYWALSRTILSGVGLLWLLRTLERGRRFHLALVSAKHFNQTRAD